MITKTPLKFEKVTSPSMDKTESLPLLHGEIADVYPYHHIIAPGEKINLKGDEKVYHILFLIEGAASVSTASGTYFMDEKGMFVDESGLDVEICSGVGARFFEIEKHMTDTDLETKKKYTSTFPILQIYSKCEQYTDFSKTPKTINRIVLEQENIPRFAMGSVESVGEDHVTPNAHPEIDQFFFTFPENDTELIINDETMNLLGDTLLHIPLGADHGTNLAEDKKMHYLWIDCLVDEKYAEILKEDHVKTNEMKSF